MKGKRERDTRVPLKEEKGMDGRQAITKRGPSAWTEGNAKISSSVYLGKGKSRNKELKQVSRGILKYISYPVLTLHGKPMPILKATVKKEPENKAQSLDSDRPGFRSRTV